MKKKLNVRLNAAKRNIKRYQRYFPRESLYGVYSKKQIENYRKAIIFIHAEIEQCLEDICTIVIDSSFDTYKKSGKIDLYLFKFLIILAAQHEERKYGLPFDYISTQVQFYKGNIKYGNHKITLGAQEEIFKPLGLEKIIKDKNVTGINYEGSCKIISQIRGEFAHRSSDILNISYASKIVIDHIENIILGINGIISVI